MASYASQTATMRAAAGISIAREPVRIAGAVPALVGGADDRRDRAQGSGGAEDPLAEDRVLSHEVPLGTVQRAGLVEDPVGDADLADVVQLRRATDLVELLARHPEPAGDRHRELGHAAGVASSSGCFASMVRIRTSATCSRAAEARRPVLRAYIRSSARCSAWSGLAASCGTSTAP